MAEAAFHQLKRLADDRDIQQHYQKQRDLGSGAFGETYEAIDVNDPTKHYAIKLQPKSNAWAAMAGEEDPEVELLRLFQEILVLNRILPKHPHIIELNDILIGPRKVFIVQELCRGPTLERFLPAADDESGRRAFKQLAEAVHTIHQYGIVHGDIKPDNVIFKDPECMQLKLIDFGCCFYSPDQALKRHNNFDYNKWFAHEELFPTSGKPLHDVDALGCTLHSIMAGKDVPCMFGVELRWMRTAYRPRTDRFSPAAMDLLSRIGPFPFGPAVREQCWSMDEICQHPWLTGLPAIPVDPAELHNKLRVEFAHLQNDLTALKRLLNEWLILPPTNIASVRYISNTYEFQGWIRDGSTDSAVLKVMNLLCNSDVCALKFMYGRVQGIPEVILNGIVTRTPLSVYMEMLIILRILPPHDNIVEIKNIFVNPKFVVLGRQYVPGGTLEDFFKGATDQNARSVFKQFADTVRFMHQHGVVHMDLHPNHCRLTLGDTWKIVNFSKAVYIPQTATKKYENFDSNRYLTPELLQPPPNANVQVDITALGRIFHAMMAGKWEPDPARCAHLLPREFGDEASDLLSKIGPEPFGPAPNDRTCNMDDICKHPWFHSWF